MECSVNTQIDPWTWCEYDRRKAELFLEAETQEEYHQRLAELKRELNL